MLQIWIILTPLAIDRLHKLLKFCDRYGLFPVFASGDNLIQPVHADDLAQAILTALQKPNIQGA